MILSWVAKDSEREREKESRLNESVAAWKESSLVLKTLSHDFLNVVDDSQDMKSEVKIHSLYGVQLCNFTQN